MRGNLEPISMECQADVLPVSGEIPRALNGTLYRNGPNPRFAGPPSHWFAGDGMLHAFTLEDGRARYRNRWVRTPKWRAEDAAGRALFAGFGQVLRDAPEGTRDEGGVANTNIVWHGGKLLALEEQHLPIAIEPGTLATRGAEDFGGALSGPFTAHPKIDPATGEMLFFGYAADGPFSAAMTHGAIDAGGRVTRFERFEAPYSSMVHDFIVTAGHLLFPILPLTGSLDRARRGRPAYAWEPDLGSHVGVLARGRPAREIRWFRAAGCYVFHVMNAWEEGSRIVADVMQFEAPPLFPNPDGTPTAPTRPGARLCRWTFDLAGDSDRFAQQWLDELGGDFPRIDDRRAGLVNRHGWFACRLPGPAIPGAFNGLAHVDAKAGRTVYALPEGDAVSEPVFVPRAAHAAEGDGWLLATVWRGAENRSDLAIFEATAIERGPVALVGLSHRVPFGFHGNWVGA